MAYRHYNENPNYKSVGDCTIRAISKVLNQSWDNIPHLFLFKKDFDDNTFITKTLEFINA